LIRGFEVELKSNPNHTLEVFINWSYQDNKEQHKGFDSTNLPLEFTYAPRHKINAGLSYRPTALFSAMLDVSWHDKYKAPSYWYQIREEAIRPLDDYTYINLSLRYRLPYTVSGERPLTVFLDARNLGNETPFETLTGFGGQVVGREFFIGMKYDWTQ
ncbi:MAG: TonB-dependent receptor, partial [Flavobacteriales bacterium]|nr:TonB-dependent receptor [Flavobacteriales bacterium]